MEFKYTIKKYGKVVCVWCSNGKLINPPDGTGSPSDTNAGGVMVQLPEGYRPPAMINATDFGTNGTRVRIRLNGNIETMAKKTVGNTVMFSVTYITEE